MYRKQMFSVQGPQGSMVSTRTVLALGAHELRGEGGVYLKLMFSVRGPQGSMVSTRTGAAAWPTSLGVRAVPSIN